MGNFLPIDVPGLDVEPLLAAIEAKPELWQLNTTWKDSKTPTFRQTDSIHLRSPLKGSEGEDLYECLEQPAYKMLPESKRVIANVIHKVGAERIGQIVIDKLPAGESILPHSDVGGMAPYYNRFHVVLKTNPNVLFRSGNEWCHMGKGEVWWFDNAKVHEVQNRGDCDRIHMIVDLKTTVSDAGMKAPDTTMALPMSAQPEKVEFFFEDEVFVKQIYLAKAGHSVAGHAHTYSHTWFLAAGRARLWRDGKIVGDFQAPTGIKIEAGCFHTITALTDGVLGYCIHNTHGFPLEELEQHLVKAKLPQLMAA
jgi:quercetin dioxygenase-like cupin family protein